MEINNFKEWMELATDLSEKTIKNYIGAIEKSMPTYNRDR